MLNAEVTVYSSGSNSRWLCRSAGLAFATWYPTRHTAMHMRFFGAARGARPALLPGTGRANEFGRTRNVRLRGVREFVAMPQGTITKIVSDRGFGFIAGERGEVFFHCSTVADEGFDNLTEGQTVQFELDDGDAGRRRGKGPRAASVKPV
jgi:cold shock protein